MRFALFIALCVTMLCVVTIVRAPSTTESSLNANFPTVNAKELESALHTRRAHPITSYRLPHSCEHPSSSMKPHSMCGNIDGGDCTRRCTLFTDLLTLALPQTHTAPVNVTQVLDMPATQRTPNVVIDVPAMQHTRHAPLLLLLHLSSSPTRYGRPGDADQTPPGPTCRTRDYALRRAIAVAAADRPFLQPCFPNCCVSRCLSVESYNSLGYHSTQAQLSPMVPCHHATASVLLSCTLEERLSSYTQGVLLSSPYTVYFTPPNTGRVLLCSGVHGTTSLPGRVSCIYKHGQRSILDPIPNPALPHSHLSQTHTQDCGFSYRQRLSFADHSIVSFPFVTAIATPNLPPRPSLIPYLPKVPLSSLGGFQTPHLLVTTTPSPLALLISEGHHPPHTYPSDERLLDLRDPQTPYQLVTTSLSSPALLTTEDVMAVTKTKPHTPAGTKKQPQRSTSQPTMRAPDIAADGKSRLAPSPTPAPKAAKVSAPATKPSGPTVNAVHSVATGLPPVVLPANPRPAATASDEQISLISPPRYALSPVKTIPVNALLASFAPTVGAPVASAETCATAPGSTHAERTDDAPEGGPEEPMSPVSEFHGIEDVVMSDEKDVTHGAHDELETPSDPQTNTSEQSLGIAADSASRIEHADGEQEDNEQEDDEPGSDDEISKIKIVGEDAQFEENLPDELCDTAAITQKPIRRSWAKPARATGPFSDQPPIATQPRFAGFSVVAPIVGRSNPPPAIEKTTGDDFDFVVNPSAPHIPCSEFNSSAFEIRVFGLPQTSADSALLHMKEALATINVHGTAELSEDDPRYVNPTYFEARMGEPGLQTGNNSAAFQTTAKVVFSSLGKMRVTDKLAEMERLLAALIEAKMHAFWSCGKQLDARTVGDFIFKKRPEVTDDIEQNAAGAWIRDQCIINGYEVLRDWGGFEWSKGRGYPHERHARFLLPAEVGRLAEDDSLPWCYRDKYDVFFTPSKDVLFPTNPCSLAIHGVGDLPQDDILRTLWKWVANYNATTGRKEGLLDDARMSNNFFIVTPTSYPLAIFICQQKPDYFTPAEMVYDLNNNNILTADQRATRAAAKAKREAQAKDQLSASDRSVQSKFVAQQAADNKDLRSRLLRLERRQNASTTFVVDSMRETGQNIQNGLTFMAASNIHSQNVTIHSANLNSARHNLAAAELSLEQAQTEIAIWGTVDSDIGRALHQQAQAKVAAAQGKIDRYNEDIEMQEAALKSLTASAPSAPTLLNAVQVPRLLSAAANDGDGDVDMEARVEQIRSRSSSPIENTSQDRSKRARVEALDEPGPSGTVSNLTTNIAMTHTAVPRVNAATRGHAHKVMSAIRANKDASPSGQQKICIDVDSLMAAGRYTDNSTFSPPLSSSELLVHSLVPYVVLTLCTLVLSSPCMAMLLFLLLNAMPVQAYSDPLRLLTLNCTGLGNAAKIDAILRLIASSLPHVIILTETWQRPNTELKIMDWRNSPVNLRRDYSLFVGQPRPAGGGVAMLIHKCLAPQAVPATAIPQAYQNQMVAVSLTLPDIIGRRRALRIIGIYAPTNITLVERQFLVQFWDAVKALTLQQEQWIVGGDFNSILHHWERTTELDTPGRYSTSQYRRFLTETAGIDAWENQHRVVVQRDYTCFGMNAGNFKSILDRFAYHKTIACRKIETSNFLIPATNHRPVVAHLSTGALVPPSREWKNLAPPRYKKPKGNAGADRLEKLKQSLDVALTARPIAKDIKTAQDFDTALDACDVAFDRACRVSFVKKSQTRSSGAAQKGLNPQADAQAGRIKVINRMIRAADEGRLLQLLSSSPQCAEEFRLINLPPHDPSVRRQLVLARRNVSKQFHKASAQLLAQTAAAAQKEDFKYALSGGPIKSLFKPVEITSTPLVQCIAPDGSDTSDEIKRNCGDLIGTSGVRRTYVAPATFDPAAADRPSVQYIIHDEDPVLVAATPAARLEAFTVYQEKLLDHAEPPHVDKDWLNSEEGHRIRADLQQTPFEWPRLMSMGDLKYTLFKGNPKPSPGPDGWEKWALRHAGDKFLEVILALVNFCLSTNYFPPRLKQNFLAPLYKRGDLTDPRNYRGIAYANCVYNLVNSWYAICLHRYAWNVSLIPDTQIAAQRGVQPGDLTYFLSQVDKAAAASDLSIFAIKRDHAKGFDNLHESAFLDALDFYGMPHVKAFEVARTSNVTFRIKSRDGIGRREISTSGQTRQGDPASVIKYVLSTSMQWRWIANHPSIPTEDLVVLRTKSSHLANTKNDLKHRHTMLDQPEHELKLLSVEAMDDSYLFSLSLETLRLKTSLSETFQQAYGISTAWDAGEKTAISVIGQPMELASPCFLQINEVARRIPVASPILLRTSFVDPAQTYLAIRAIVDRFPMPTNRNFPLSILRKAVRTLLMAQIRPRLQLNPITPRQAMLIDTQIAEKVAAAIGVRHSASDVLTLPLRYHGFDFPSVWRINGETSINMLLRALNHHLHPMRRMASITLTNWQCWGSGCAPPLMLPQVHQPWTSTSRSNTPPKIANLVPISWAVASHYMALARISITATDVSAWEEDRASHVISHLQSVHTLTDAQANAMRTVANELTTMTRDKAAPLTMRWSAWTHSLEAIATTLNPADARRLRSAMAPLHRLQTTKLSPHDPGLLIPRQVRRLNSSLALRAAFIDDPDYDFDDIWATDGSSKQDNPLFTSTTAAVVGPGRAAFKILGCPTSSLHGELLGLIAALVATKREDGDPQAHIITDHLTTVRRLQDMRQPDFDTFRWRRFPASEWHMWLHDVAQDHDARVTHVKAHTGADDDESKLNDQADRHAKQAHTVHNLVVGPPTAYMEDFVPICSTTGQYQTDTWKALLARRLEEATFSRQTPQMKLRLGLQPQPDDRPVASYFFTKSPASTLTRYQYILRAGNFWTNSKLAHGEGGKIQDWQHCELCGADVQDEEHVFLECPAFDEHRTHEIAKTIRRGQPSDKDKQPPGLWPSYVHSVFEHTADRSSRYWYGLVPPSNGITGWQHRVAQNAALSLAGRIASALYGKRYGSDSSKANDSNHREPDDRSPPRGTKRKRTDGTAGHWRDRDRTSRAWQEQRPVSTTERRRDRQGRFC